MAPITANPLKQRLSTYNLGQAYSTNYQHKMSLRNSFLVGRCFILVQNYGHTDYLNKYQDSQLETLNFQKVICHANPT